MVDRYRCSSTSDAQERWSPQITPSPEISLLPFNTKDTPSSTCMTVIDVLVGSVKERRCENGIPVVYTQRANCSWNIVTTYALRGTLNQAILLASGGIGSRYRGPDTAPFSAELSKSKWLIESSSTSLRVCSLASFTENDGTRQRELVEGADLYTPKVQQGQVLLSEEHKCIILETVEGYESFRRYRKKSGLEQAGMTCGAGYELLLCGASGTSKAMTWTSRRCSGRTSSCNMTAESLAIECAAYETSRRLRKASTGTRSQAQWWLHQERHLIAAPEGHFEKWRKTVISQVDIVTGCVLQ
ncbi:hypothetical protein PC122_g15557 [Phytophthora cactorum]|nr:hypothetical protein PC122_g15557 [Phytophthora cactorum]